MVMAEDRLIEKLRSIEALFAGAQTPGERHAAACARDRISALLRRQEEADPPVEYRFSLHDPWTRRLFTSLLRRYELKPFRYARQRRTTVMVNVPASFVEETLWPQFEQLSSTLATYLNDITDRVIRESIDPDCSEADIREPALLDG
jgi:hypothetical protein